MWMKVGDCTIWFITWNSCLKWRVLTGPVTAFGWRWKCCWGKGMESSSVCVSQCCTLDHRPLLSHLWQNFPHLARTHCLPVVARRRGWPRLQSRVISRPRDSDACCISASARSNRREKKRILKKNNKPRLFLYTHPLSSWGDRLEQWNKNNFFCSHYFFIIK